MADRAISDSPALQLQAAFRQVAETRMHGVAMLNPVLAVEAVGFRDWRGDSLGVLITPWFMNLICLPAGAAAWATLPSGSKHTLSLPAGEYEFLTAHEDAIGPYLSSSLFSPMFQFPDQDHAREVALGVLEEVFKPARPATDEPQGIGAKLDAPVSRRGFLSAFLPRDPSS